MPAAGRPTSKSLGQGLPRPPSPHATSPRGLVERGFSHANPGAGGERGAQFCAPYPWGTDTATARGAEGPRGHETLRRGSRPQPAPGNGRPEGAGRGRVAQGARLVAASPPPLLSDEEGRLGPRGWGERGGGSLSPHAAQEGSPAPSRGEWAPISPGKLTNKLQSREKGDGSLGAGLLPALFFSPLGPVHVVWSRPSPRVRQGRTLPSSLYGWSRPRRELPGPRSRRDHTLGRRGNSPASGRFFHSSEVTWRPALAGIGPDRNAVCPGISRSLAF